MAARMRDIAKDTGFSINTVSLALNGSDRISENTRNVILDAAMRLHYVPNKAARSLVTQKSNLIGLVVRELKNIIINEVAASIEIKLSQLGYRMIVLSTEQHNSELNALEMLQSHQVDGIMMFPSLPPDKRVLSYIRQMDTPVVLLSYGEYDLPVDAVYMDKTYAAYSTIRYLVELKHRRIGFICNSAGNDQTQYDCEKFNGYMRALADSGIAYDPTLTVFAAGNSFKAGYDAARHLYRRSNATAVYGTSDLLACGAMNYYLSHGVKIPEQVSFAGNDSTELAAYAPVPLTSSLYLVEELTEKALRLLMDRIDKAEDAPSFPQRIVLKPVLEVRASTVPYVEKEE